jgi:hypothetical protein
VPGRDLPGPNRFSDHAPGLLGPVEVGEEQQVDGTLDERERGQTLGVQSEDGVADMKDATLPPSSTTNARLGSPSWRFRPSR